MISTCARFFIRIRIHKSFSIDDGILLFGIGYLISGMVILLTIIDKLYLVEAVNAGVQIELPSDVIEQVLRFPQILCRCPHFELVFNCSCEVQLPVSLQEIDRPDAAYDCLLVGCCCVQRSNISLWLDGLSRHLPIFLQPQRM